MRWTPLALIGLAIAAELGARFVVGLGDPPLTIRDPQIEYMFAPSRCYTRFHNRVCYNRWSMRSPELTAHKAGCERRVVVLGDSIVNGGSLTDQDELATEVAKRQLEQWGLPTTVGNISAGSWGPANIYAYTQRFGWFDADLAIFIFNTDDLIDLPVFAPDLGVDFPSKSPRFALEDFAARYLPGLLSAYAPALAPTAAPGPSVATVDPARQKRGLAELERLLMAAQAHVAQRVVFLHYMVNELGSVSPAEQVFREISERTGATFVSLRTQDELSFYHDNIHLTPKGQRAFGELIANEARHRLPTCSN